MENVKQEIMDFMVEQKKINSYHLKVRFRHRTDYDRALSALIDENKLQEKFQLGHTFISLGMAE